MVAGRLPRSAERDLGRHAADAALDVAGVIGGIPAGAASEREERSALPEPLPRQFCAGTERHSLASAISRRIGAIPQLVVAMMSLRGTNFDTVVDHLADLLGGLDRVAGDVDHAGLTILPLSSASRSSGTFELRHSIATCWIELLAIAGKISSYCRHSLPSVCFQSVLALMP